MKNTFFLLFLSFLSCNTGDLKVIADLPDSLREVSGLEVDENNNVLWMVNDSGNKPILYGLNPNGTIITQLKLKAKNRDWEDLTMDPIGNVYIGNFGNNANDSKGLTILKISKDSLNASGKIGVDKINFVYPEQTKFPPKKKDRHFDCEAFFFYQDSLYLFTKSRSSEEKRKTNLYQLPAKAGNYNAKLIGSFNVYSENKYMITSADINDVGDLVVLLTEDNVVLFSDFKDNSFLNGHVEYFPFDHDSQKESVSFKNDSTLYIADEYVGIHGGNLYEFRLKK